MNDELNFKHMSGWNMSGVECTGSFTGENSSSTTSMSNGQRGHSLGMQQVQTQFTSGAVVSSIPSKSGHYSLYGRSNEYEELPNGFQNPDYGYTLPDEGNSGLVNSSVHHLSSCSSASLRTPEVSLNTSIPCSSASDQVTLIDGTLSPPAPRRRVNPVYGSFKLPDKKAETGCKCEPLMIVSVLALFFALLAIAIAAATAVVLTRNDISPTNNVWDRIDSLERLLQTLNVTILGNKATGAGGLVDLLNRTIDALRNEYMVELNSLRDDVTTGLLNISKMPGPQGPPGIGNLSECTFKTFNRGMQTSYLNLSTVWIPTEVAEAETRRITGVTCSTAGGVSTVLESQPFPNLTQADIQYRCSCFGKLGDDNNRRCRIHYWSCPLLS